MSAPAGRLSCDLSVLYVEADARRRQDPCAPTADPPEFDVVIVGSGYGGAMAAAELAGLHDCHGRRLSVLVLERGKEYLPGMFPSAGHELPTHMRVHRSSSGETFGALDALFDLRIGPDVSALVGSGLGGGSLINAGVMAIPDWHQVARLPVSLKNDLTRHYMRQVRDRLGAAEGRTDNTISRHQQAVGGLAKTQALASLGGQLFDEAPITVETQEGAALNRCRLCGDCMTGCNVGAKKSLDTNLLLQAWRNGARIVTGASVTDVARLKPAAVAGNEGGPQWEVNVVFTDQSLQRRHEPLRIRAGVVILAAGTLGSPEILLRSQSFELRFSPRLGEQFSCNGDNILAVQGVPVGTDSVAPEHVAFDRRRVGPTITGNITMPKASTGPGFLIQEFAVPAPIKRVFDELVTTSSLLQRLPTADPTAHTTGSRAVDPLAVDPQAMERTLLLGVIGHDEANGQLSLPEPSRLDRSRALEGRIRISWPGVNRSRMVEDAFRRTQELIQSRWPAAQVLPNPMWRMLPGALESIFPMERGPLLTVHPLGGCPIGNDSQHGVVDSYGQVYDFGGQAATTSFHKGLLVLDGSIVPASLGANPALTIAAIAQRAARHLAAGLKWTAAPPPGAAAPAHKPRPMPARVPTRSPEHCTPRRPAPTRVELIERLWGPLRVGQVECVAELTLRYRPRALARLMRRMNRQLHVVPRGSMLRVYLKSDWDEFGIRFSDEPTRAARAMVIAPVSGSLKLLDREASSAWLRTLRGATAYFWNRGTRDAWSWLVESQDQRARGEQEACGGSDGLLAGLGRLFVKAAGKWRELKQLASRAGEVRRFDYHLVIGVASRGRGSPLGDLIPDQSEIRGHKRFTYSCRGNPWRQLTELKLTAFPSIAWGAAPVLKLDGRFLAGQGVPLARIVSQNSQVTALAELASLGLYFLRLVLHIHVWTFRAPEKAPERKRNLLPGPIKGLPIPEITEIELEPPRRGIAVTVRLTRYRGRDSESMASDAKPPLVMIHGYSASGSTFTHQAIPEPMARYFWNKGRDVWVLDLRTSAGMASALLPWNFEDAALADIPVAIQRILKISGRPQVDVFAHCIGAVMLSMALLTNPRDSQQLQQIDDVATDGPRARRYLSEVEALQTSIRKVVLSQKGPVLVYSDGNVLRAYLMRVLRHLVLPQNYQFRTPSPPSMGDQLLDRALSSLPYPDEEHDLENPLQPCARTAWAGFRHRMDILYARDFSLRNLAPLTLAAVEDLFGPLNLDSVSQAVHFARYNKITNGAGRNCFVTVTRMRHRWPKAGTLSVHGEDNGLADVRTLDLMGDLMQAAGLNFAFHRVEGFGHQDCLIGKTAKADVLRTIEEFLR